MKNPEIYDEKKFEKEPKQSRPASEDTKRALGKTALKGVRKDSNKK
jgi:hypothetical protein